MPLALTYTFAVNTPAEAAEVNANFDAIESYINGTLITAADVATLLAAEPKGYIAQTSLTADSAVFTTIADITSYSVTFTGEASRRYLIMLKAHIESSVAGDYARLTISTNAGTVLNDCKRELPVINESQSVETWTVVTPGAGSVTYKVQGERLSGTGNVKVDASATSPALLLVTDLGT